MKTTRLLKKIKKGFTLLELTIAMLATSLLLTGFTVFTVFFSNQYQYEMSINDKSPVRIKGRGMGYQFSSPLTTLSNRAVTSSVGALVHRDTATAAMRPAAKPGMIS